MTAYLLAIDSGSQSTKVSVVDPAGTVHATGRVALRPYHLGPGGRAVHPDDDLWDALVAATRLALGAFAGRSEDVVAVGLCGIRFCRALLDADGRLTEPVMSWMDDRVSRPLGEVDPAVATVTSAGGYLAVRLTGERRDSSASYRGMWPVDPVARDWSSDPAEVTRTGMPRRLLPDLVDPGELLGRLTPAAAAATGLPVGRPVVATANDKAVEALGCGVTGPGSTVLSLGTYVAAMTVADAGRPVPEDGGCWGNAAAVPGTTLLESRGIRRGMWTVSWLRQLVSAAAPGHLDEPALQDWLDVGARLVPPGCDGLVTLPDWLAPGDAPYRRGAILGLDASHGPHHLHRSVLEGLVLTMCGHVETLEECVRSRPERLVVAGGGSRSALMLQLVADVFARPAERPWVADAAGTGAAICAAVGAGVYPDLGDAATAMVRPGRAAHPDPEAVRRYEKVRARYAGVPGFTDPMFRWLAGEPRGAL